MKRIVVCCDGTWNQWTGDHPTNVVRVAQAVSLTAPGDAPGSAIPQIVFYDEGVGTGGGLIDRIRGGAFGYGLDKNVEDAYRFLVNNYEQGDEIYLFGFSRGAYTARSTAGVIRKCGLLTKQNGVKIGAALSLYRLRDSSPDLEETQRFRRENSHPNPVLPSDDRYAYVVRIHFLGVWDTVGSLGVPLRSLRWVPWNNRYKFHDERLSSTVKNAFHAVSIDEQRGSYEPTLWDQVPAEGQRVEQTWFAGVHSEVGGGSSERGLSSLALGWMIDKARECGLAFDEPQVREIKAEADPAEKVDKSLSGVWRFLVPYHRRIGITQPVKAGLSNSESLHPSVCVKLNTAAPPYRPENVSAYLKRSDRRMTAVGAEPWNQPPANRWPDL
jgi:uncharacterized protein (DUF2235 family)